MSISDSEVTPELTPLVTTPGGLLRHARESAGLTLEYVAKELHMSLNKVRALEADDYTTFNANTFVRGYLRAYASLLKLDCTAIIATYEQQVRAQGLLAGPQRPITRDSSPKKMWSFLAALVLLMAGLWLISVWFFDNQVERPLPVPSAIVAPPPAPVITIPQPGVTAGGELQSPQIPTSDNLSVAAETGESALDAAITEDNLPAASVTETTERTLDKLVFHFSDECWLEVSDAQGDVLATELQRPGTSVSLLGVAPFTVKLGNASAAQMTLNDVEVVVKPPVDAKVLIMSVGE